MIFLIAPHLSIKMSSHGMSENITALLQKLINEHPTIYFKIQDAYVPSHHELYNFELIRISHKIYEEQNMSVEMYNSLPVILSIEPNEVDAFNYLTNLLYGKVSDPDIETQISFIMFLMKIGNRDEIYKFMRCIKFDNNVWLRLTEFHLPFNMLHEKYLRAATTHLISIIYDESRMCKFKQKCRSLTNTKYRCAFKHSDRPNEEILSALEQYGNIILKDFAYDFYVTDKYTPGYGWTDYIVVSDVFYIISQKRNIKILTPTSTPNLDIDCPREFIDKFGILKAYVVDTEFQHQNILGKYIKVWEPYHCRSKCRNIFPHYHTFT